MAIQEENGKAVNGFSPDSAEYLPVTCKELEGHHEMPERTKG